MQKEEIGLTEQEKAALRNTMEAIARERERVLSILQRFNDLEHSLGVGLVRESLHYGHHHLFNTRALIDEALIFNHSYLENKEEK